MELKIFVKNTSKLQGKNAFLKPAQVLNDKYKPAVVSEKRIKLNWLNYYTNFNLETLVKRKKKIQNKTRYYLERCKLSCRAIFCFFKQNSHQTMATCHPFFK